MVQRIAEALIALVLLVPTASAFADVKSEEKTQMKFEGGLGRMMGLFGGKAMKDGLVSTAAVKGDRKLTMNDTTGQIIDLKEEKVYELDVRDRTYTVMTFDQIRQRMEDARRKAAAEQQRAAGQASEAKGNDGKEPQFDIDFDLKETGQTRTIAGYDAREIVMTVIVREKGRKLEESGGLVLTTTSWLAAHVPALKEATDFDIRYAQKLGPMLMDAQQMAAAMAMYPMLQDAMARMQKEKVNLDGTPLLTVIRAEAAGTAERAAASQNQKQEVQSPESVGGLGGMLARRMMRRNKEKEEAAAPPGAPGRATIFTMQHEVMKIVPTATDADVAVPAGFTARR